MKNPNDMNAMLAGGDRIKNLLSELECRDENGEQSYISHPALAQVMKKTYLSLSMILMQMCDMNTLMFSNGRTQNLSIFCMTLPAHFPHTLMGMTLLAESFVRMFTNEISEQPCIALRLRQNLLENAHLMAVMFGFACLNSCFGNKQIHTAVLLRSDETDFSNMEKAFRTNPLYSQLPGATLARLVCK